MDGVRGIILIAKSGTSQLRRMVWQPGIWFEACLGKNCDGKLAADEPTMHGMSEQQASLKERMNTHQAEV